MNNGLLTGIALALALGAGPAGSHAVDPGAPDDNAIGVDRFDANDYGTGQVSFAATTSTHGIAAQGLGGGAGETFTIVVDDDTAAHHPGAGRHAGARYAADRRTGGAGLLEWNLAAGLDRVGVEIAADVLAGSATGYGASPDAGAPNPLVRTAFGAGSGYRAASVPLTFGLRPDAVLPSTIAEPGSMALIFAGIAFVVSATRRRRR